MTPEQVLGLTSVVARTIEQKVHESKYTGVQTIYYEMPNYKPPRGYGNNTAANRPYITALLRIAQKITGMKKALPHPGIYLIKRKTA